MDTTPFYQLKGIHDLSITVYLILVPCHPFVVVVVTFEIHPKVQWSQTRRGDTSITTYIMLTSYGIHKIITLL